MPRIAFRRSGAIFDRDAARSALAELREKTVAPDFWSRPDEAQEIHKNIRVHEKTLETSDRLDELSQELQTLAELLKEGEPAEPDAKEAIRSRSERGSTCQRPYRERATRTPMAAPAAAPPITSLVDGIRRNRGGKGGRNAYANLHSREVGDAARMGSRAAGRGACRTPRLRGCHARLR